MGSFEWSEYFCGFYCCSTWVVEVEDGILVVELLPWEENAPEMSFTSCIIIQEA